MPKKKKSLDEFIMSINNKINGATKNNNTKPNYSNKQVKPSTSQAYNTPNRAPRRKINRSITDYLFVSPHDRRRLPSNRKGEKKEIISQKEGPRGKPLSSKLLGETSMSAHAQYVELSVEASNHRQDHVEKEKLYAPLNFINNTREIEQVVWDLGEIDDIVESATGYIIDVKYDGDAKKAVVYFFSPKDNKLYRWFDRSGHMPYFLALAEPEELSSREIGVNRHESFMSYSKIEKINPLTGKRIKLTKINVTDPLAVRDLRQRLSGKGIPYYEADIKYHHNYIYDKHIIPGLLHKARKDVSLLDYKVEEEALENVKKVFRDEPEDIQERALKWIPIFEQPPPEMKRIAIDIEVYTPYESELPDPEKALYPIVSIALVDDSGNKRVLVLDRADYNEPLDPDKIPEDAIVEVYDSELEMLLDALRIISEYPVIITFNGDNFDLPYLYNRLIVLGVNPHYLPFEFHQDSASFRNMLHVDLYKFFDIRALQVYAFGNAYREKNLDAIAEALLGKKKVALDKPVPELDINTLINYNLTDAELTMELTTFADNLVWNLIILLMRISKLGLEDVTRTQVSGWIRSLMHWEHRKRNYLIPSKQDINQYSGQAKSTAIIKDKKYKGAIVLKPPQGVFFNILVLDFASLYPTIIKNWNLSYETVNNPYCKGKKIKVPEVGHEVCMSVKGITSELVGLLRDFRVKIYKKRAKDKNLDKILRLWYNTVQSAMKVYINASYGVFGNETFNYYSLAVAESVTAIGRTVLKNTLKKARELDLMIIYGDTDSVFMWDPPREKLDDIISYVKEEYGLDLEIDKEFKIGLFSGLKKNYIGIGKDGSVVIKGMVGKKSNTPEFLKKEFQQATKLLAEINEPEDVFDTITKLRDHIHEIYYRLRKKEYTLDELAIKIMLSKDPKEYKKNTPQHVKAALLLRKYGIRVTKGTVITFVKTRDKLGVRPVKLARLSEVDTSKYQEYVRTVFEQMIQALGVNWESLGGQSSLLSHFS
ncbi:MAG: DNA-directed DNA polymerase I [Desulfurococcales archaeon]|nr:DNA-directed DNA polymerase I [Desulfurococcales archaeon]